MTDPRVKYQEALVAFAAPGGRWANKGHLTYWGRAAGLSADEIIADARAAGVTDRNADIRRGWADAAKTSRFTGSSSIRWSRHAKQKSLPTMPTDRVRKMIKAGEDILTMEALRELSPVKICHDTDPMARRFQSEQHLLLLFGRSDVVQIRRTKNDKSADLRTAEDWMNVREFGELVRPNPFTGKEGKTTDGKPSFISKNCIATFRHMVFESDKLSIEEQCQFWAGFIRCGKLPLVSLTYSGDKSIHGVVRVNAPDVETYSKYQKQIVERYASDPDERYRLDVDALDPLTGCRLAGVVRKDTGAIQELLYVRREWFDARWQHELNPTCEDK